VFSRRILRAAVSYSIEKLDRVPSESKDVVFRPRGADPIEEYAHLSRAIGMRPFLIGVEHDESAQVRDRLTDRGRDCSGSKARVC
jgi:hypothetical protein